MSGSPKTIDSNQTQSYTPSAGEQPGINQAFQEMTSLAQTPRDAYPNQTFAGASPFTQAGLYGLAGSAGQMAGMQQPFQQSWERGLNASDVANNPYVNNMMDANAQQVNQNMQRNMLPGIQQGAVQAGGANNARQGIAQGVALGDAATGLANANASTQMGAYSQGLSHEQAMMNQAGNLRNAYTAPWQTLGQAGAGMEGYQQQAINDAMGRFNFDRNDAESRLSSLIGQLGDMRYGTQVGTGSQMNPNYQSPLTSALQIGAGVAAMPMTGGASLGGMAAAKMAPSWFS